MSEYKILDNIDSTDDVKKLNKAETELLCDEIREELIKTVSKNGGHLASNLGVVELTVALHKSFNSPADKIVWDVGHQSYTHKLITGRRKEFSTLRKEGGLSGFPKPSESIHDPSISGHSSTSISVAFGLSTADKLANIDNYTVAVIGDGALTGGLAYEALNNAGRSRNNLIVILNDNQMSISKNVGAMARYLAVIRSRLSYFKFKAGVEKVFNKVPVIGEPTIRGLTKSKSILKNAIYHSTIFEDMGFQYLGPIDGHDLDKLSLVFEVAKAIKKPTLIHVHTIKGKGYCHAESNPKFFHGVSSFDIETGEPTNLSSSFSEYFGKVMCELAETNDKICAVSAAMAIGTGLAEFRKKFKNRFFDVGIAEEHAVTFSSGLANGGFLPVFAVYSSFLQRCYDQILHDAAIQNLNVVLAIDRAGIVGEDGETHQGIYDTSFLNSIPNITVYSPSNYYELKTQLNQALFQCGGLAAVRYPRGSEGEILKKMKATGKDFDIFTEAPPKIVLITYGRIFEQAVLTRHKLKSNKSIDLTLLKLNKIKPIHPDSADAVLKADHIFFFEEGIRQGGIAERFGSMLLEKGYKGTYKITAVEDGLFPHAPVKRSLELNKLDSNSMVKIILRSLEIAE